MAAEGPLHELGAIAIINSDSQGMGRIMETVRRTFQLAHVMRAWRRRADRNAGYRTPTTTRPRVLRYLAKVTIEPAITHGIADHVGSLRAGPPRRHRPVEARLLRGEAGARHQGRAAGLGAARRGQRDASRAPSRRAIGRTGAGSVARRARLGHVRLRPRPGCARPHGRCPHVVAVAGTRGLTRTDLVHNRAAPPIEVDVTDGSVRLDGRVLAVDPVSEVPLSRRYLLR